MSNTPSPFTPRPLPAQEPQSWWDVIKSVCLVLVTLSYCLGYVRQPREQTAVLDALGRGQEYWSEELSKCQQARVEEKRACAKEINRGIQVRIEEHQACTKELGDGWTARIEQYQACTDKLVDGWKALTEERRALSKALSECQQTCEEERKMKSS